MGCDIHTSMQRRIDGAWEDAQEWENKGDAGWTYLDPKGGQLLHNRNYTLFGALAGVRRDDLPALAPQRGLPEDVSSETEQFHDGNHSATHFSVAEVMAFDWTQAIDFEGWVTPQEYALFKVDGKPQSYCSMVGGGGVIHISNREMERLIIGADKGRGDGKRAYPFHDLRYAHGDDLKAASSRIQAQAFGNPYTLVHWQEPLYESATELLSEALPRAWRMGSPEDVRFIVSFDS